MSRRRGIDLLCVWLLLTVVSGCRAHQLLHDQDQFRQTLMNLYTNQIMDNLIRASQGLPIIQVDYTAVTGTITQEAAAGIGGSQTFDATRQFAIPPVAHTLTRRLSQAFNYTANAKQTNQMGVEAKPLLGDAKVYNAYLNFVFTRSDTGELVPTGKLIQSCDPPPPGAAHVIRRVDKTYYWIPIEFKYNFLELAMITTSRVGPFPAPTAFEAVIKEVFKQAVPSIPGKTSYRLVLKFDRKLFNDSGTLEVPVKNRPYKFSVVPYHGEVPKIPAPQGDETEFLSIAYSPFDPDGPGLDVDELVSEIINKTATLHLDHSSPKPNSVEDILGSMRMQTQQIIYNQLRQGTGP
jgi:hypothetical protein